MLMLNCTELVVARFQSISFSFKLVYYIAVSRSIWSLSVIFSVSVVCYVNVCVFFLIGLLVQSNNQICVDLLLILMAMMMLSVLNRWLWRWFRHSIMYYTYTAGKYVNRAFMVSCWAHVTKHTILLHSWYSWYTWWVCCFKKIVCLLFKWNEIELPVPWCYDYRCFPFDRVKWLTMAFLYFDYDHGFSMNHTNTFISQENMHWIVVYI